MVDDISQRRIFPKGIVEQLSARHGVPLGLNRPCLIDVPHGQLLTEARAVLTALPDGIQAFQARLNRLEERLADARPRLRPADPLTEREEAVLRFLRGTLSIREISQELCLSANTIKTHTQKIYRKLGVSTRSAAIEQARERGILR